MAKLRTRKWGCALGITLLIAVPVVLAVWLGQMLMRDASTLGILREMPMYRGAQGAEYTWTASTSNDPMDGAFARLVYHVNDIPEFVEEFYEDMLPRDGWTRDALYPAQLSFHKIEYYPSGLYFEGSPPWVGQRSRPILCSAHITALEKVQRGERYTEVTVQLITMSAIMP
jgi:hypothetical protein